jgi:16S rRNA (uracil1498-N3)-methyltransferase
MPELPEFPGGSIPHVIVADISAPELTAEDRHHLERVVRLRSGDPLSVTDGAGAWRWCRFGTELVVDGEIECVTAPSPRLSIAFALVKGQKPELVVQKLTELGVDEIIPFVADRSIVRWDDERSRRNTDRLRKVSREASMQSRRIWLPDVHEVTSFASLIDRGSFAVADRDGSAPSLTTTAVMIGPEGGWSDSERERFSTVIGLGGGVLRAETAAFAAATVLSALRSGLVMPACAP